MFFKSEAVLIFHQPSTIYGSSFVFFRHSDVISAGDIFDPTQYPIIDIMNGGSIQGVLQGLNRMKLLMVPADRRNGQQGGTLIIPGHGRLCTYADLAQYLDMVTVMRDRIQYLIKKGMSLEQVKAAKPTRITIRFTATQPATGRPICLLRRSIRVLRVLRTTSRTSRTNQEGDSIGRHP